MNTKNYSTTVTANHKTGKTGKTKNPRFLKIFDSSGNLLYLFYRNCDNNVRIEKSLQELKSTKVQGLSLSFTQMTNENLVAVLQMQPMIEKMSLIGCHLHLVPAVLSQQRRLKALNLRNNDIKFLPPELAKLELTHLDLAGNDLTMSCIEVVSKMPTLNTLNLSKNSLEGIVPEVLDHLTRLRFLHLNSNQITFFQSVFTIRNLTHLDISNNALVVLPSNLAVLLKQGLTMICANNKFIPKLRDALNDKADGALNALVKYMQSNEYKYDFLNIAENIKNNDNSEVEVNNNAYEYMYGNLGDDDDDEE